MMDKKIKEIGYNFLNLPRTILITPTTCKQINVTYNYRADGTKLSKKFIQNTNIVTTDYLDGFQYEHSVLLPTAPDLKFVPTAEGYYNFENNKYIYNYVDHLGNVRVSYFNNGSSVEVLEENNYYPFGLKHEGYNVLAGNSAYRYKYNGKELQTETGMYDYGARFYMPDIGRWGVVDPLAEEAQGWSPFRYGFNNPINFSDPTGMLEDWYEDGNGDMVFNDNVKSQQDLTNLGIEGTYKYESGQEGDLTYAADGFVYDDSTAGGGKAIANGRETKIEDVILKGNSNKTNAPWMDTAFSQIGVTEFPGARNNPIVIGYHSTTTLGATTDSTPWCASFINYCFTQNNIPSLNSARAFDYKKFGYQLNKPAYGAVAIMNYSHVGFVAGENSDGRIILLGGNQGDAVNLSPNSKSAVLQYRYPNSFKPNYTLPKYNLKGRSLTRSSSR